MNIQNSEVKVVDWNVFLWNDMHIGYMWWSKIQTGECWNSPHSELPEIFIKMSWSYGTPQTRVKPSPDGLNKTSNLRTNSEQTVNSIYFNKNYVSLCISHSFSILCTKYLAVWYEVGSKYQPVPCTHRIQKDVLLARMHWPAA